MCVAVCLLAQSHVRVADLFCQNMYTVCVAVCVAVLSPPHLNMYIVCVVVCVAVFAAVCVAVCFSLPEHVYFSLASV